MNQKSIPEDINLFTLFCTSLRILGEANSHHRTATTEVAGNHFPCSKFYHDHDRIDAEIGTVVSWLTDAGPSTLSTGPQCELRVLILLNVLGARIQLFNTAVIYAQNSKLLKPVVEIHHKESVSTAIGVSEVLFHAGVLKADKVTSFSKR